MPMPATWAISGLKRGRPFASNILRHGRAVGRVAGEAVDGLGRDGDDVAGLEERQRLLHRLADLQDFRHSAFRLVPGLLRASCTRIEPFCFWYGEMIGQAGCHDRAGGSDAGTFRPEGQNG